MDKHAWFRKLIFLNYLTLREREREREILGISNFGRIFGGELSEICKCLLQKKKKRV
jgi:hypothetical protein